MQDLRDLGLAGALSTMLYTSMVLIPPAAAVLIWLAPLPGLVFAARSPGKAPAWFLLTVAALTIVVGGENAVAFAGTVGVATLVIAFAVLRSWSIERTAVTALFVWFLGVASLYVVGAGSLSAAASAAQEQVDHAFSMVLEASVAAGAETEAIALLEAERATLVQSVLEILPALIFLTGGAILCVNLSLTRRLAPAFEGFRLRYWHNPDNLIWVFIAAGFGLFAPVDAVSVTASNVFVCLLGCYFLQGLAVITYYFDRFRLPIALRVGTYLLIAIQQLLAAVVLALGIFDLWGDFRRLHTGPADASIGSDGD
jgi:uncharacterized protein YybS (DUF2232 family)